LNLRIEIKNKKLKLEKKSPADSVTDSKASFFFGELVSVVKVTVL
jgi:hypothetical protein